MLGEPEALAELVKRYAEALDEYHTPELVQFYARTLLAAAADREQLRPGTVSTQL